MKDNLVLFCKTYRGDWERFKNLKQSIDKYNFDRIPLYISCPSSDIELFSKIEHSNNYQFIIFSDEDILGEDINEPVAQNWINQQIIKLKFYKQNVCNFYVCIDSDSFFIRNFFTSDFMYNEVTPYITMYENKYFKEIASIIGDKSIFENCLKIKNYFQRKGKDYFYWNNPVLSAKVLEELEKNIDTIENLIKYAPLEYVWHGEYLLKSKCINFIPCESNFKFFSYEYEYNLWRGQGELLEDIEKYYAGIIMQNRWCKKSIYNNSLRIKFNRRINRLKFFVNMDRTHIHKNFRFYRHFVKDFIKILIGREL